MNEYLLNKLTKMELKIKILTFISMILKKKVEKMVFKNFKADGTAGFDGMVIKYLKYFNSFKS